VPFRVFFFNLFSACIPFSVYDVLQYISIYMLCRWVRAVSEFLCALHDSPCMHRQKVVIASFLIRFWLLDVTVRIMGQAYRKLLIISNKSQRSIHTWWVITL
jgi:hypothetical protein